MCMFVCIDSYKNMDLCNQSCLASQPALAWKKTWNVGHCQFLSNLPCLKAPLISTVLYHFPVILTLAGGHKVSAKHSFLASFSSSFQLIKIYICYGVEASQVEHLDWLPLLREIQWNKGNKCFTDCIKKLKCWHAFTRSWLDSTSKLYSLIPVWMT